jgi:deoxyhypusine synthase
LVKDYTLSDVSSFSSLIKSFLNSGGFVARDVANASNILLEMYSDKRCLKFLSFTANIVSTGLRGVLAEMVSEGLVDIIVTTGGTLDHDIARSSGGKYLKGDFAEDDKKLRTKGIHRLGNVFVPVKSYGPVIERFSRNMFDELSKRGHMSTREISEEIGKRINDENSILSQAFRKKVPVYVPGIVDSAFGTQLYIMSQKSPFFLDLLKDEKELTDHVFSAKCTGGLILGGGISKHHLLWFNQYRGGLDYAVGITTSQEYDGSLSGAKLDEAISWNKVKPNAKVALIYGDVTVMLPLVLLPFYETKRRARTSQ